MAGDRQQCAARRTGRRCRRRALVAAYPTPANWRDALVAYRQLAAPQEAAEIDLLRLMRTAGALIRPAEYQRLAQLLLHAGFAAEGRAVLDEGIARGVVNRSEPPTPAISAEIDRAIARQPARRRFGDGAVEPSRLISMVQGGSRKPSPITALAAVPRPRPNFALWPDKRKGRAPHAGTRISRHSG